MIRAQQTAPAQARRPAAAITHLIHPPVACEDPHVEAILAVSLASPEGIDIVHDEARLRIARLLRLAFCGMSHMPSVTPEEMAKALRRQAEAADEPFITAVALRAHRVSGDDPALRLALLADQVADANDEGRVLLHDDLRAMGFSTEELNALGWDALAIANARTAITAPAEVA
ncbi:hypothetical protein SAMN05519104_6695 [Rhizobiales bacterium GAS188]|nr:hypothetical protein SAMN05519104_6695 [Rhizobiales bacterium GAS188]